MATSTPMSLRRLVLLAALRCSMVWDLVTAFLGILIILDTNNVVAIGIAVVGTLIVVAFNFATRTIWHRPKPHYRFGPQLWLLRSVWLMAICVDLWTSLTCNAWFLAPSTQRDTTNVIALLGTLTPEQFLIVVFVTCISAVSPMMVGYLRGHESEFLR